MQILQICTEFGAGGIGRHAVDLGRWLRLRGHRIGFVGASGKIMDSNTDDEYFGLAINRVSSNGNKLLRILYTVICAVKLRLYLKKNSFELIHCHESAPAIVARLATVGMHLPILLTYHGSEPKRTRGFALVGKYTAQQIITPSYRAAAELRDQGGLKESMVRVIGLGVKQLPALDDADIKKLRKDLLGADGNFLIAVVARIDYQKGIDILIQVAVQLKKQQQGIRIVIVGDGPIRAEMESLSSQSGVDDIICFAGYSSQPHVYLKASDLFLLTSRWEALPISIVEAFRAGLPVIAADTSGVAELVDSSVGDVLPIGDVEGFTRSILNVCNDSSLRRQMSERALKRSQEDRFSPDTIHSIFEKNYAEVLGVSLPS